MLQPPSARHLFGTDDLGRDIFSGVIHGARTSLLVGFTAAGTTTLIGVLVGELADRAGAAAEPFEDGSPGRVAERVQCLMWVSVH